MDDDDTATLAQLLYTRAKKRRKNHQHAFYNSNTGSNLDDDDAATLAELLYTPTRKREKNHEHADHSPNTAPNKKPSDGNSGNDCTATLAAKGAKSHRRADHNPSAIPNKRTPNPNSNNCDCEHSEVMDSIKPGPKRSNLCPPRDGFRQGDFVWVKAFPHSWCPGSVDRLRGSSALVAFFGYQKTCWFSISEIRGFEEGFHSISKMVGARAKKAIDLTLEELSRRTALGLMSCCRASMPVEAKEVRERFEPNEMLGFVLDLAVSAQVAEEDTARAVRLSAQVYALRHLMSVCQNSQADGEFVCNSLLESIHAVARTPGAGDEDIACIFEVVDQLVEYRRFILGFPQWMYRAHEEDDDLSSDESEGGQEMSDSSTFNEAVDRKSTGTEDEVYIRILEMDFEIAAQSVPEGREISMISREDITLDKESDSLLKHQPKVVAEQNSFIGQGIHLDAVDAEGVNNLSSEKGHFSHLIDNGSGFCLDEGSMVDSQCCNGNSLHNHVADLVNADCNALRSIVASDSISGTICEGKIFQENNGIDVRVEHKNNDSNVTKWMETARDSISRAILEGKNLQENNDIDVHVKHKNDDSNDTHRLETAPCAARQLRVNCPQNDSRPADKSQEFIDVHSSTGATSIANKIGSFTMVKELCREVTCDQPLQNFFKLHKSLVAYPEAMLYARRFSKYASSVGYESRSYDEILARSNVTKKASNHKRDQPIASDLSKLASKTKKPSINPSSRFPKTLHMKFPRGYTVPSKEELENKFGVIGPLDCSRTKVFSYTGAALVVFLHQADAYAAYKYVKRKNIFRHANVRFWVDKYENHRKSSRPDDDHGKWKGSSPVLKQKPSSWDLPEVHDRIGNMVWPVRAQNLESSALKHTSNVKPCLRSTEALHRRERKKTGKVRFVIETS